MAVQKINPDAVARAIRDVIVTQGVVAAEAETVAAHLGVSRPTLWRQYPKGTDWQTVCRGAVAQYEQRGDLKLSAALEWPRQVHRAVGASDVTYGPRSYCSYGDLYQYARERTVAEGHVCYSELSRALDMDRSALRRAFGGSASRLPQVLRKLYPDDPALR